MGRMTSIELMDTDVMVILHALDVLNERGQDTIQGIGHKLQIDSVTDKMTVFGRSMGIVKD